MTMSAAGKESILGHNPDAEVPEVTRPELAPGEVAPDVDPRPQFYFDWRGAVTAASVLNLLAGIWLIVSPFALDYVAGDSRWNPVVCGALVAFLALMRVMGAYRAAWLAWISVALGAWMFASGFWLAESLAASWNAWLLGLFVIVLALLGIDATEEGRMEGSRGGGEQLGLR